MDETENFTVTMSDMPVIEAETVEEKQEEVIEPVVEEPKIEDEKPREKSRAQKRIEALIKEKHELTRALEEAKATKTKPEEYKVLDPDDFEDYDDYLKAVAEDKPKEEVKEPASDMPMVLEQIQDKIEEASEKYPELDTQMRAMPILTEDMLRAINESDEAGEVANYLANNPEAAKKLSQMSITKMAVEIGRIETKVLNPVKEEVKQPPKRKQTQAPEPITPIGGSGEYVKSIDEMSFSEFEKTMNAQASAKKFW